MSFRGSYLHFNLRSQSARGGVFLDSGYYVRLRSDPVATALGSDTITNRPNSTLRKYSVGERRPTGKSLPANIG